MVTNASYQQKTRSPDGGCVCLSNTVSISRPILGGGRPRIDSIRSELLDYLRKSLSRGLANVQIGRGYVLVAHKVTNCERVQPLILGISCEEGP